VERDAAESPGRHRGGGLAVKVHRLLATTQSTATTGWVVTGRCAGGANAIVNSCLCSRIETRGDQLQA